MPDGREFAFASDRPGGHGAFDIWYGELSRDGKVTKVTNAGNIINTAYDEQAPYLHIPSNTFVFASNGHVGMGGYDLFFAKRNRNQWTKPQNFGYPVNSIKDDIYFASRGPRYNILQEALVGSNRNSDCCLELFYIRKKRPLRKVTGTVMECEKNTPLTGAIVLILDTINNKTIATTTTDAQGRYTFTIEDYQPLKAVASLAGYIEGFLYFEGPDDPEEETFTNAKICLLPSPPVETPIVLENVFYDFNIFNLRNGSYPSLDKLVTMMTEHPNISIEISAHTDNIGNEHYNQKLSELALRT